MFKLPDFSIEEFIEPYFNNEDVLSHKKVVEAFLEILKPIDDKRFIEILICNGFIPDYYGHDSTEETLYSKMIEVIVAEWANRMGFESEIVTEKSNREDIAFSSSKNWVVCDAKSFRLGRSQQAPNHKDFLKLADITKWIDRRNDSIGGLIVYPCKHEWKKKSAVYMYCSSKDTPCMMFPYKYLALFLHFKDRFPKIENFFDFWNHFSSMFPTPLQENISGGNKKPYWNIVNRKILQIVDISESEFKLFISDSDKLIDEYIVNWIAFLKVKVKKIKVDVEKNINLMGLEEIKQEYLKYKTNNETFTLNTYIERIKSFRL